MVDAFFWTQNFWLFGSTFLPRAVPPLYPGAGLYETKEMITTDGPDSILETKTTILAFAL